MNNETIAKINKFRDEFVDKVMQDYSRNVLQLASRSGFYVIPELERAGLLKRFNNFDLSNTNEGVNIILRDSINKFKDEFIKQIDCEEVEELNTFIDNLARYNIESIELPAPPKHPITI